MIYLGVFYLIHHLCILMFNVIQFVWTGAARSKQTRFTRHEVLLWETGAIRLQAVDVNLDGRVSVVNQYDIPLLCEAKGNPGILGRHLRPWLTHLKVALCACCVV